MIVLMIVAMPVVIVVILTVPTLLLAALLPLLVVALALAASMAKANKFSCPDFAALVKFDSASLTAFVFLVALIWSRRFI